ncbi:MAG: LysE family translocator [Candidatus Limnocylindrales bacterium]
MPELHTVALFAAAAFALIVVPGPNMIYILTRGIGDGRRAALVSAVGVEVGTLVHILAAAVGVSALIAASSLAFDIVRLFGAAYLIYLGVRAIFAKEAVFGLGGSRSSATTWIVFRQGVLVNVLNPKVALFFLAFLPQFIDPMRGPAATQILALGVIFFAIALAMDILYAMASGSVGSFLRRRPQYLRWQRYLTGSVYIGLGLSAAVTGRNRG